MTTLYTSSGHAQPEKAVQPKSTPEHQPPEDTLEQESGGEPQADVQQTHFSEEVIMGSSPKSKHKIKDEAVTPPSTGWKKYRFLAGGLGIGLVVVLTLGLLMPRSDENMGDFMPTPIPNTPTEMAVSALERELILLEKDVESADPLQAKLAFPPVNFTLTLQEATLLQNQRPGSR